MKEEKEHWINEDGNFCFLWKEDSSKGILTFLAVILGVLLISAIVDAIWEEGFIIISLIAVFIACSIGYYTMNYNSKKKDAFLLSIVQPKLDELIESYISEQEGIIKEEKRCVFYHTKGTYGIILGIYILVLFSNGNVIKYILQTNTLDNQIYYELQGKATICKEEECLKAIIPHYTLKKIANYLKLSAHTQLKLVIIGLFSLSSLFVVFTYWMFIHFGVTHLLLYISGYVSLCIIFHKLANRFKKLRFLDWIVNKTLTAFYFTIDLAHPAMIISGAIIIPIMMIAGITIIVIKCLEYSVCIKLSYHTLLFIVLTTSEIICVHAPNIVQHIIKKSPLKNWGNHKYEAYHEDLALYISSSKNFNFIFSILYAIFLTTNAFYQLEYHSFLFSADIDNAILKSFLVFLAFTAMKQKSKDVDINTKDLLEKIIGLFSHDEQNLK